MEAPEFVVSPAEQTDDENEALQRTEKALHSHLQVVQGDRDRRPTAPKLVFEDGRRLELSPDILNALHFVVHHMARGEAVSLVPMTKLLTTSQAAEILNVSRPYLAKLLDQKLIPFTMIGSHHRLRLGDVLQYKQRRDSQMLAMVDELAAEAQDSGNYFDE